MKQLDVTNAFHLQDTDKNASCVVEKYFPEEKSVDKSSAHYLYHKLKKIGCIPIDVFLSLILASSSSIEMLLIHYQHLPKRLWLVSGY